jgi:hypothetical protein
VSAVERPASLRVIQLRRIAPRPTNLRRGDAEVLDMTPFARLILVLRSVKPQPHRDARSEIGVALEARRLVDALS